MKKPGKIVLFQFPQTNHISAKLRPALLLSKIPGNFNDWLVCMISTQIHQAIKNHDEIILKNDPDFKISGLKSESLLRIFRLAVVDESILIGAIGEISKDRLLRIKLKLSDWLKN